MATTYQLTVNVPVDFDLKYIDVWPNDPTKDKVNGKGFGASVSLKGFVAGEEVRVYPKGFVNRTIEKLVNAGVVDDGHYQHDPAEKYSIKVKQGKLQIVNAQPSGEKYANFDVLLVDGKPVQAKPKVKATAPPKIPAPSHSNVPDDQLPDYLRDADAEDNAALEEKVGVDLSAIQSKLAIYQGITEWYLANIPPLYEKAKIGCSPESAAAGIHTLFITANK
jgi:hypothetical protein